MGKMNYQLKWPGAFKVDQQGVIRRSAFMIALVYLSMSTVMSLQLGGHALKHGQGSHHAKQHVSLVCTWMCAASTPLQSMRPPLEQARLAFYGKVAAFVAHAVPVFRLSLYLGFAEKHLSF